MSTQNLNWSGWVWLAVSIMLSLEHINILIYIASPATGTIIPGASGRIRMHDRMRAVVLAVVWTWTLWLMTP